MGIWENRTGVTNNTARAIPRWHSEASIALIVALLVHSQGQVCDYTAAPVQSPVLFNTLICTIVGIDYSRSS